MQPGAGHTMRASICSMCAWNTVDNAYTCAYTSGYHASYTVDSAYIQYSLQWGVPRNVVFNAGFRAEKKNATIATLRARIVERKKICPILIFFFCFSVAFLFFFYCVEVVLSTAMRTLYNGDIAY